MGYRAHRQADPRIEAQLARALGKAATVVNVGAGAGSYEPVDRRVLAIEPSAVMIGQRADGAPPVVMAPAETLPLPDRSFDAALAVFSAHHWDDLVAGLDEMARVAPHRVLLTWDQDVQEERFWLLRDYVPELIAHERSKYPPLDVVCERVGATAVEPVPVPHDCTDGFFVAYWRRPEAYLDPARRAAISAFALASEKVVAAGLARLQRDLESGVWNERYADLLHLDHYDAGYRLVIGDA